MAEYTNKLGLYKPNRADAVAVDTSLSDNFTKIDNEFIQIDTDIKDVNSDLADLVIEVGKKGNASDLAVQQQQFTIAHRGYSARAPENTMIAYQYALEAGFKAVETDIGFTSDGVPVLLHDATVDRTTNGTGAIGTLTLTQVKALDAGSWFGPDFVGEKIPTLEELLVFCRDNGLIAILELKGTYTQGQIDACIALVEQYNMEKRSKFISFGFGNLGLIRNTNESIPIGYLTESFSQANMNSIKNLGNAFINLKYTSLTAVGMEYANSIGLPVAVYTVNDVAVAQNAFRLGVLAVTSDQIPSMEWGAGTPISRVCTLVIDNGNIYIDDRFENSGFTTITLATTYLQMNIVNIPSTKRPVALANIDFYGAGPQYRAMAGYATNTYVRIMLTDLAGVVKNPALITDKIFINVGLFA